MATEREKIRFLELTIVATSKSRSSLIAKIHTARLEAELWHCISPKCLVRKHIVMIFLFVDADFQ